ncbi:MAG: hypothetical protein BGO41_04460 [Clostridiales bacterium 38-18]|nr:MAG: hypothetical protein BGO41_04460 [Clostridiales bacterium 38-18]
MINKYDHITDYFENTFQLDRIKTLPITDKFRLINYIKLVSKANDIAKAKNIDAITNSPVYNIDHTFHLFVSLLASELSTEAISDIIECYAYNFDESDVYFSKIVILGSGALMIQKGIESNAIISYLISLLGEDFLKNNYKRIFDERDALDINEENEIDIKYKNFDMTYRKLKYDLLALRQIKKEQGHTKLREIIFKYYDNKDLSLYFSMLDVHDKKISEYLYRKLMKDAPKMDRFLLTASRCMIRDVDIIDMHYLLNAVIGKYTNFMKPYSEVVEEIKLRENEILSLIK